MTAGTPMGPSAAGPTLVATWSRRIAALAALVAIAPSAALVVPYVLGVRGFCAAGAGCDKVAQTEYSHLFGIPRAWIGLLGFVVSLALVSAGGKIARRLAPVVGVVAAAEAIHLLAIQAFIIKAFCKFCVVADTAAIVMGIALIVEALASRKLEVRKHFAPIPLAVLGVLVAAAPVAYAAARPPPPVAAIEAVPRTADGKLVVREFVDLECPYCRATHAALKKVIANRKTPVVIERRHVPLGQHPYAMGAAVAACCAAEQGAEDAFVDAVVASKDPPTEAFCRKTVEGLGLDLAKYDACTKSERPKARILADAALADKTKVPGLPTIDVDAERHVGLLEIADAEALLSRHP